MGCYDHTPPEWEWEEKRHKRITAMRLLLEKTPLTTFTADYTFDICVVFDPQICDNRKYKIDNALDRLEKLFKKRK